MRKLELYRRYGIVLCFSMLVLFLLYLTLGVLFTGIGLYLFHPNMTAMMPAYIFYFYIARTGIIAVVLTRVIPQIWGWITEWKRWG